MSLGFAGVLFFLDDLGAGVSSVSLVDVSLALTGVLPFFVLGVGAGSVVTGASESSVLAGVLTDFAFLVAVGDTSSVATALLDLHVTKQSNIATHPCVWKPWGSWVSPWVSPRPCSLLQARQLD